MTKTGEYELTVGIEIHAELNTATKMFCRSKNDPDEAVPNQNICPVCMAHPGTLPVINKAAVQHVLRVGLAIGGTLADYTEFDRKNYFYPDLPKGYQISQYEYPLISGGMLHGVELTRIHLEEDTARSSHDAATGSTVIDYNRAGVPLMELVTEPVVHSAEDAGAFARELRLLLRALGASEANMEKGQMRVEANISAGKDGVLGTKVEVKNLNSIKAMERAIEFEFARQVALLEQGGVVEQETRGWDENAQKTFSQRTKEGAADYRYFPDPDIPPLKLSELPEFSAKELQKDLSTLPWELHAQYLDLGLSADDAEMYVREEAFRNFFDDVREDLEKTKEGELVRTASNYITTDLAKLIRDSGTRDTEVQDEIMIPPAAFAEIIRMIGANDLSSRGAKDLLAVFVAEGGDPRTVAEERGLLQSSDTDTLKPIIERILAEHAGVVEEYKGGKEASLQFLVGQGMKATKGTANPEVLKEMLLEAMDN